jgi:hypothetical protein
MIIFLGFIIKRLEVFLVSIPLMFILPILWYILPIKIPSEYVGLIKQDKYLEYVYNDYRYCKKNCQLLESLILDEGYNKRKTFYSWRYAELLDYNTPLHDKSNYHEKRPFDIEYLFGILLVFEITFEYIPLILILTLLNSIYLFFKKKKESGKDLILMNELKPYKKGKNVKKELLLLELEVKSITNIGLVIFLLIIFYNILYIYSL